MEMILNKKKMLFGIAICIFCIIVSSSSIVGTTSVKTKSTSISSLPSDLVNFRILNLDWNYWSNSPNIFLFPEGNVGIGISNPTQKLQVNGTVQATAFIGNGSALTSINVTGTWNEENNWYSTSGKALTTQSYVHILKGNVLRFWSSTNSLVGNIYGFASSPQQLRIQADSGGDVAIVNDAGQGLIVKDNNRVGIGTTTPSYTLDVEGDIQAHAYHTGDIFFQQDGKTLWRMFEDEQGLYLQNMMTKQVYRFVLQDNSETQSITDQLKELQTQNNELQQRIESLEQIILSGN